MAKNKKKKREDVEGIFVPAGVLLGLGFGFIFNNIPAYLFIGLGLGFLLMAIAKLAKKK